MTAHASVLPENQGIIGLPNNYASGGNKGYQLPMQLVTKTAAATTWTLPPPHGTDLVGPTGVLIAIAGLGSETVAVTIFDSPTQSTGVSPTGTINLATGAITDPATLGNGYYMLPKRIYPWKIVTTKSATSETAGIAVTVVALPR